MLPTLPKPRAILFDWDNTLVDTWPTIHAALNMTLRFMNVPEWSLEKVRREVKKSMRESFPDLFGDQWQIAADYFQKSYRSIHLQSLQPIAGAQVLLEQLATHAILGVVSNKKGDTLRLEIAHLGWEHFFPVAIGAGDAARDKPHADPALLALEKINILPARDVWFIGDTSVDLECANAAHLTPIWYGDHDPELHAEHILQCAAHVPDYTALIALISGTLAAA